MKTIAAMVVLAFTLAQHVGAALAQSQVHIVLKKQTFPGGTAVESTNAWSRVHGLSASGEGFLSVRAGPGVGFAERDRLRNGRLVVNPAIRGEWRGVIYANSNDDDLDRAKQLCGLDDATAKKMSRTKQYAGPCKWGWVNKRWLVLLAD